MKYGSYIKTKLRNFIVECKNLTLDNSIVLISAPRGGSTWLTELLAKIPGTIINWEPFHPKYGTIPKILNTGSNIYIPEDEDDIELSRIIRSQFEMKVNTPFTLRFVNAKTALKANRILTKSVRASRLLPYLVNNLKFKNPPLYLLRHPIPTSISHIKAFGEREWVAPSIKK